MKAIRFTQYGAPNVLQLTEAPTPKPNEILVKNHAFAVTAADIRIRGAKFPKGLGFLAKLFLGLFAPRTYIQIPGTTLAGEVTAVGAQVSEFAVGDKVLGMKSPPNFGTYVEYLTIPQDSAVTRLPKSLSFEEGAALLFGGTTALYFLRDLGKITKGESILVIGASGAVGTNAVQLAKHFGAKVTGVCSAKNTPLVKSLGADHVIDYKTQPLDACGPYDIVLNAAQELSVDTLAKLVRPGGKVLLVLSDLFGMLQSSLPFLQSTQAKKVNLLNGTAPERKADVQFLSELASSGKLKAVIDKEYAFEEIVAAHEYVDKGHKVGNVIVRI